MDLLAEAPQLALFGLITMIIIITILLAGYIVFSVNSRKKKNEMKPGIQPQPATTETFVPPDIPKMSATRSGTYEPPTSIGESGSSDISEIAPDRDTTLALPVDNQPLSPLEERLTLSFLSSKLDMEDNMTDMPKTSKQINGEPASGS